MATVLGQSVPLYAPTAKTPVKATTGLGFWRSVYVSPAVATISILGAGLEAILLAQSPGNVLVASPMTAAVASMFLVTFWFVIANIASKTVRCTSHYAAEHPGLRGRLAQGSLLLTAVAALLVYVSSWGLYLQAGRFMNFEAVAFLVANLRGLWNYLLAAEVHHLVLLILATIALFAGLPLAAGWIKRSEWKSRDFSCEATTRPCGYAASRTMRYLAIATLFAAAWVTTDISPQRRGVNVDALKYSLNPIVALSASGVDSLTAEKIAPTLDTSKLVPRTTGDDWKPAALLSGKERWPSVIIVAVESLRSDTIYLVHQGKEVLPNINALSKSGIEFKNAYSESTHSDYADVCLVSSLYPLRTRTHHYYHKSDPWPKAPLYDLLKDGGYSTAIISSQNEVWGGMDEFLDSPKLDKFYHPERSDAPTQVAMRDPGFAEEIKAGTLVAGKFPDAHTTGVAIDWIAEQVKEKKPFFLSLNFQSSHFPYLMTEDVPKPFQPCQLDSDVGFMSYPKSKTENVRNAYFNGIHECDRQIGRLVAELKKLGIYDDTILIVTGENGEAFHENNSVGHAREPVQPAIHVACVLHAPSLVAPKVETYPLEHVDLAPTVLGLLGWPQHPNHQGIDVLSKDRPPLDKRLTYCHVLSPAAKADSIMQAGRWKLVVNRNTGATALYDIQADPGETHDLSLSNPSLTAELSKKLSDWRRDQLAYYHYPMYYQKYFPPKP